VQLHNDFEVLEFSVTILLEHSFLVTVVSVTALFAARFKVNVMVYKSSSCRKIPRVLFCAFSEEACHHTPPMEAG